MNHLDEHLFDPPSFLVEHNRHAFSLLRIWRVAPFSVFLEIELILVLTYKSNSFEHEQSELGQTKTNKWGSVATLINFSTKDNFCFEVFVKVRGGLLITKSIWNIIPILLPVSEPSINSKNQRPGYFSWKDNFLYTISGFLMRSQIVISGFLKATGRRRFCLAGAFWQLFGWCVGEPCCAVLSAKKYTSEDIRKSLNSKNIHASNNCVHTRSPYDLQNLG